MPHILELGDFREVAFVQPWHTKLGHHLVLKAGQSLRSQSDAGTPW
eukprot:CAMPEP_0185264984 /NCGR_PEP_ID=MMETSP1359-20130426/25759_1 /TAXON_ID=552665 /ORGANISM="Bigelowiella longifila, Strain CCMP242" /LENGTH=45 /DNA_ID= /DNA_START= /DNA_END= /DNA_ORIENTATION=